MKENTLVFEKKPLSWVHSILKSQGFTKIGFGKSLKYKVALRDSSTESIYWLEIPVDQYQKQPNQAKLGKPLLYGEKRIPQPVKMAVESKLHEIADYLRSIVGKKVKPLPKEPDYNSSMVQNEEEMKRLGKEMESMKTNKDVSEDGEIPDPVQYEEEK
ncbi:MAG: hypothetical protein K6T88_07645 [Bacillus sp. (in: Bacteria)]|nr:hypothetical protein [Bacillus sp. (in: firmicutes)]